MSVNFKSNAASEDAESTLLPSFSSRNEVKKYFAEYPLVWEKFLKLPAELQKELLGFCVGEHGIKVTYDPVFQRVFHPNKHPERMESFLSSFLGRTVRIIDILPRQGTQMVEKVYCIILMEQSPGEFHTAGGSYIHKRSFYFNTGIFRDNPGLHEEYFICLDIFHSNAHNITKYSTVLDAWLTFFSATERNCIKELVRNFPMFLPVYQEITDFVKEPEELMHMFSEALYIMDHNAERLMVSELRDEVNAVKNERDAMQIERDVFERRLKGKTLEEIAEELSIDIEKISEILGESDQGSQNE